LLTAPFYAILGTSQDAGVMISGSISLAVLLFSTYGIGNKLAGRNAGLLGAFIVSMYPVVFNQLRVYLFDLPLCAFVSLNLYLLLRSSYFRDRFFTVLYALSLILGALIKFNFFAFIIGPLGLVLYQGFGPAAGGTKKIRQVSGVLQNKRFLVLLVIVAAIVFIFGAHGFKMMAYHLFDTSWLKYFIYFLKEPHAGRIVALIIFWFYSSLIFVASLVNESLSFFFSLIFIIGLLVILRSRFKQTVFLLLPILLPLFFLICFFNVTDNLARYMLPGYVCIALMSSIGIMRIKITFFRRLAVTSILCIGFMQYFVVSYGCNFIPREIGINLPGFLARPSLFFESAAFLKQNHSHDYAKRYFKDLVFFQQKIPISPQKNSSQPQIDCKDKQIINRIMSSCHFKKGESFLFLDYRADIASILYPLTFEAFVKIKTTKTVQDPFFPEYDLPPNKYLPVCSYIITTDYVAIADGVPEGSDLRFDPVLTEEIRRTKEYFYNHLDALKLVCKVDLTDGRELSVYKNILNKIIEGPFEIGIKNGYLNFFYQGRSITTDNGFYTQFVYNQKRYFSSAAALKIQKPDVNRMLVYLSWPGTDLVQLWDLRLQNGRFYWQIYLENYGKLLFEDIGLRLELDPLYQNWHDHSGEGYFPRPTLFWLANFQGIQRKMFSGNALTIEPANFSQNGLPGLLFSNLSENLSSVGLCTDFFNHNQRKVCIFYVDPLKAKPEPAKGKFLIFSGRLSLLTDVTETEDKDILIRQEDGYEN
jgi:hypothetical protein